MYSFRGVTKQMWDIWTTPGHKYSLTAKKRLIINNRLIAIKPRHEIHRIPRSLISKAKWKATEWRSWLLFYSYPCLHEVLENIHLQSFLLLVRSVYILLKTNISEENLLQCELDLLKFVGECEILYGEEVTISLSICILYCTWYSLLENLDHYGLHLHFHMKAICFI